MTIALRDVQKAFGSTAVLTGVDLEATPGSFLAILGPSGEGKTTLLRLIAGFDVPDAGTIEIDGVRVAGQGRSLPPERRRVGVVPQEGALFPHLTVAQNVGFGLRRRQGREERVAECLSLVGLEGFENRRPQQLSGGQQQRVAVARALAPKPSVVLLDEPFSALDAGLRAKVRHDVRQALRMAGATSLLVTHDQEEAFSMADAVAVLRGGRIAQVDDPVTVYTNPSDLAVATFVGHGVVLDGQRSKHTVTSPLGVLRVIDGCVTADGPVRILLRPEQLRLGTCQPGVPAQVTDITYFGHDALVRLTVNPAMTFEARITPPLPRTGQRVFVWVDGPVAVFPPDQPAAPPTTPGLLRLT